MEIRQSRFSNKTAFVFGGEALKYTLKDMNGRQSFSVPYTYIPRDTNELEERNPWFRNVGLFWMLIGVVQVIYRLFETGTLVPSLWLILGLVCFGIYRIASTRYLVLNTEKGSIFVIHDRKHEEILHELATRRKNQLKTLYGAIDYHNDPSAEMNKFRWLFKEGVITRQELEMTLEEIRSDRLDQNTPVATEELVH
jgi:hypothetical protein